MPYEGIEGMAARIGDATRLVQQAHRVGERHEITRADETEIRLMIERLAHLATSADYLKLYLVAELRQMRDEKPNLVKLPWKEPFDESKGGDGD